MISSLGGVVESNPSCLFKSDLGRSSSLHQWEYQCYYLQVPFYQIKVDWLFQNSKLHLAFNKGCEHDKLTRWNLGCVSLHCCICAPFFNFVCDILKLASNYFLLVYVVQQQLFNWDTMRMSCRKNPSWLLIVCS